MKWGCREAWILAKKNDDRVREFYKYNVPLRPLIHLVFITGWLMGIDWIKGKDHPTKWGVPK